MDICAAITAFFSFLATPEGQKVCADVRTADQQFNAKVAGLVTKLHDLASGGQPAH